MGESGHKIGEKKLTETQVEDVIKRLSEE